MLKKKITYYFFFFFFANSLFATPLDSLLSIVSQSNLQSSPLEIQNTHHELGLLYYNQEESFELAKNHLEKALEINRKNKDNDRLGKLLYDLGKCYKRINNYPKALECYFNLIELKDSKFSDKNKGRCYGQIASIYQALGNYDKAYQFQMEGLSIHENQNNEKGISKDLYILGTIFYYQKRYQQSLEYYLRSKEFSEKVGNKKGLYACLEALGSVYTQLKNYDKSDYFTEQALELAKSINYKTGIAYSLGNKAGTLSRRKKYKQAELLNIESNQLKSELGDSWGLVGGLINLGNIYIESKKPANSIQPLFSALKLSKEIDSKTRTVDVFESLNRAYHLMGQTDSAYFYLEKFVELKDSLLNEKTVEEMGKTKNLYEIEKKEQEIKLLKTKSQNQKLQKYIFIIVGIFLMFACYGIFSRLKYQRATNSLLEDKNAEIQIQNEEIQTQNEEIQIQNLELQHAQDQLLKTNILLEENNLLLEDKNEEIEEKNKLLEDSNDDLKNFAYVASHDLKEPLRMVSSYTTLIKKRYHDQLDETGQEFMHYVIDGVDRMKVMLDDLLSYSRVGTQGDNKTWVDMSDIMVIVNSNLSPRLREQGAKLIIKEKNLPAVKANNTQMIQLLQNLVSNGIKFRGERAPEVTVDCRYDNNKYIFSVADNGIGISEENKKKVFEMFKRLHTRDEYEGTGIGLATCKKIVTKHGGELWVESTLGEGSTFLFSIPCPIEQPNNHAPKTNPSAEQTSKPQSSNNQLINSQAER